MVNRSQSPQRFQFGIAALLWAVRGLAAILAILRGGVVGGVVSFMGLLAVLVVIGCKRQLCTPVQGSFVLSAGGLVMSAVLLLLRTGERYQLEGQCRSHLKHIGLALHNYHSTWGSFPPAITRDENGRPMHSWRMLIMPYIETPSVYLEYRLDEPWNGPHNRMLADRNEVYQCPADAAAMRTWTSYVGILGDETAWSTSRAFAMGDFTDGVEHTILITEVVGSGIHWMEPRDLHVSQMAPVINSIAGQGMSSRHKGGVNALFGNGATHFLNNTLDRSNLAALLTKDGKDDAGDWRETAPKR